VQIYETADDEETRKYEGQWEKDKRHGYGNCHYSNGSHYIGYFKNDLREGYGNMRWEEGWEYDGYWREGRLFGKGNFKTLEVIFDFFHFGLIFHKNDDLSGIFKNNNFSYVSKMVFFSEKIEIFRVIAFILVPFSLKMRGIY